MSFNISFTVHKGFSLANIPVGEKLNDRYLVVKQGNKRKFLDLQSFILYDWEEILQLEEVKPEILVSKLEDGNCFLYKDCLCVYRGPYAGYGDQVSSIKITVLNGKIEFQYFYLGKDEKVIPVVCDIKGGQS